MPWRCRHTRVAVSTMVRSMNFGPVATNRTTPLFSGRLFRRAATALCVALTLALIGSYIAMLGQDDAGSKHTDFVSYYSGSNLVLHGHADRLYDFNALGEFERQLVHPLVVRNGVLPYVYPPFLAVALTPLAALPFQVAYLVWLAINCLLLVLCLAALQRLARLSGGEALLFWAAGLSFLPVFIALAQGQTSILLAATLTGCFLAARSGRDELAGGVLALVLIKPPYVIPILLVFAVRRRWRALGAFLIVALVIAVAPLLIGGSSLTAGYVQTLFKATQWKNQFGYGPQWNHSLRGFAELLLPGSAGSIAGVVLAASSLAALTWVARHRSPIEVPLALAALVCLLYSPHVLIHDLTVLVLPAAVALSIRIRPAYGLMGILAAGYTATLVGGRLVDAVPLQISVIAMVALAVWLIVNDRNSPSAPVERISPDAAPYRAVCTPPQPGTNPRCLDL